MKERFLQGKQALENREVGWLFSVVVLRITLSQLSFFFIFVLMPKRKSVLTVLFWGLTSLFSHFLSVALRHKSWITP